LKAVLLSFILSTSPAYLNLLGLITAIEGQMAEVKGRIQLLDDLRNRRRCWELKEEAEDLLISSILSKT